MAKKKFGLRNILAVVAAVLGIAAFVMLFVPQLKWKSVTGYDTGNLSGLNITFGYSEGDVKILTFSVGNFLTYVFALVGVVFSLLAAFGKLGKLASLIATAAFVAAAVCFFCAQASMTVNVGKLTGDAASTYAKAVKDRYALGAGAIVGGVMSILAGAAAASNLFIKK